MTDGSDPLRTPRRTPLRTPRRVGIIAGAAVLMVLAVLSAGRQMAEWRDRPVHPPAAPMASPGRPIPAEANAFRLHARDVSVPSAAERRTTAHPRTIGMYRSVRAYPGAPPRVAHGLTAEEFRTATCSSCHEKGGYVPRFQLYAPLTPHPEYGQCLQCHVPDDDLVGVSLPDGTANSICLQCHRLQGRTPAFSALDWQPAPWPELGRRALEGSPPRIPHDLQLRGNCLACHAGPAAVTALRTTHPERSDCRSCHVPAPSGVLDDEVFTRPAAGGGGTP